MAEKPPVKDYEVEKVLNAAPVDHRFILVYDGVKMAHGHPDGLVMLKRVMPGSKIVRLRSKKR